MRKILISAALSITVGILVGCAGSPSSTTEPPASQPSFGDATPAAPTLVPGSTPLPWLVDVLALQTPGQELAGKFADIAVVADGTLFLADTKNHRIVHLDGQGGLLNRWGSFSGSNQGQAAPTATFNEPWGIGLDAAGTIYIADTWNHRIQAFTLDGEYLHSWGQFGQGADHTDLYGPRDVAVGADGLVYVSDTGNKRIVVYTAQGEFVNQVGGEGNQLGQFIEPVGIAFSQDGRLFVADQGNRRVQVLVVGEAGSMKPVVAWQVDAWPHNDMLYKPYLCVVGDRVFLTDTEAGSVLEYTTSGEFKTKYDLNSTGVLNYGLVYGIASQADGALWVSDLAGGAPVLVKIMPAQ